jgi:hypothetical protein
MNMSTEKWTDLALHAEQKAAPAQTFSGNELSTISAICSRVMRIIGLMDREGLQRDIAIVQANCPLDLESLAAAPDKLFVQELLNIVDSTDRHAGSLSGTYRSCFMLQASGLTLV